MRTLIALPNPRLQERGLGEALRRRYADTVSAVLMVTGHARLGDNNPTLRRLIEMRNPHVDPINVVQVQQLSVGFRCGRKGLGSCLGADPVFRLEACGLQPAPSALMLPHTHPHTSHKSNHHPPTPTPTRWRSCAACAASPTTSSCATPCCSPSTEWQQACATPAKPPALRPGCVLGQPGVLEGSSAWVGALVANHPADGHSHSCSP